MTTLRAGPLTALLDGIDLRQVCAHGIEAFRRVYVAVRDPDWATIPGAVTDLNVAQREDSFEVSFSVHHHADPIDYTWRGTITGTDRGTITYRMGGMAVGEFDYNRIGFCVLHPDDECAGQEYWGTAPAGAISGRLSDLVAPQPFVDGFYVPLIEPVSSLSVALRSGGRSHLECRGELFETEDQRNWTDSSYKTYCTPMALGFPHHAPPGQTFVQEVRLSATGVPPRVSRRRSGAEVMLGIEAPNGSRVPTIGLGPTSTATPVARDHILALRSMSAHHVRIDVHLDDRNWKASAQRSIALAHAIHCPLELAIFMDDDDDFGDVTSLFAGVPIARLLAFAAGAETATPIETTPTTLVRRVRDELAPQLGDPAVGGGTDMYFCELNRTRPDADSMDFVAYSIMPQEHASDDRSLFETLRAQAETVRSARMFTRDRPIVVGPITLLPRGNRPRTDHRQAALLTGAWTAGSIKYLSDAGGHAASYYEPTGDRGVISTGGTPTPAYHVLRWAADHGGAPVRGCSTDDHRRVIGLALGDGDALSAVLVVNLTDLQTDAGVIGVADRRMALVGVTGTSELLAADTDEIRLRLGPYAVAALRA